MSEDDPMLVLEHAEKGSLDKSWGTDTGLAAGLKKALAADAACGLLQVHTAGLVHRDVAARCVCSIVVPWCVVQCCAVRVVTWALAVWAVIAFWEVTGR